MILKLLPEKFLNEIQIKNFYITFFGDQKFLFLDIKNLKKSKICGCAGVPKKIICKRQFVPKCWTKIQKCCTPNNQVSKTFFFIYIYVFRKDFFNTILVSNFFRRLISVFQITKIIKIGGCAKMVCFGVPKSIIKPQKKHWFSSYFTT